MLIVYGKTILSAFLLLAVFPALCQQRKLALTDSLYSSVHSVIVPEHEPYTRKITAPDGLKFVTARLIDDPEEGEIQRIRVTVGKRTFTLRTKGRGAEILWSPDSHWLAVTYTYCCSGFSPYLQLYEVSEGGVRDLSAARALVKDSECRSDAMDEHPQNSGR